MLRSQQDFTLNKFADLTGQGVLIAVLDSGIDYSHMAFRSENESKIEAMWDQQTGKVYSKEQIDYALSLSTNERRKAVNEFDSTGHGTAVAGIAIENAPKASLLIVKLGKSVGDSFSGTSRLMEAIDWVINYANDINKPVVVNLSFGNNDGPHNGRSLLERYIDDMALIGRSSFVIGTGNEGSRALHYKTNLKGVAQSVECEFQVAYTQRSLNIQIWKQWIDDVEFVLELPNGEKNIISGNEIYYGDMKIYTFVREPTPYNNMQQVYIEFVRGDGSSFLQGGSYKIIMTGRNVVAGRIDMWMPSGNVTQRDTLFLKSDPDTSLTVPSTSFTAISVAAIDSKTMKITDYSGRGYLINELVKPDIGAPGTDILAPAVGGGYSLNTGTSMAAPFISGYCAKAMQWGIVQGNDEQLYGLKLKEFVKKNGNRQDLLGLNYPNQYIGWGSIIKSN